MKQPYQPATKSKFLSCVLLSPTEEHLLDNWRVKVTALGLAMFVLGFSIVSAAGSEKPFREHVKNPSATTLIVGLCEGYSGIPNDDGPHTGMVSVPSGSFLMGSNNHYDEEAVQHQVQVRGFWIDRHDVTNAQFANFVRSTGYVTTAERTPASTQGIPSAQIQPGGAVFSSPNNGKPGRWSFVLGANWQHPNGPESSIQGKEAHPVVQVTYEDALAYAKWLGRDLPTEAQWEYAARGGLSGKNYVWGDSFTPEGKPMANSWQGPFPLLNEAKDGYLGTSPVGCYPANGLGLVDMAGNVWQWTKTVYVVGHSEHDPLDLQGSFAESAFALQKAGTAKSKVIKGGSHLCAPNYCMRYRPAARQPATPDLGTSHIGFRTVLNSEVQAALSKKKRP
jgi:formylglycine-generating enzyme